MVGQTWGMSESKPVRIDQWLWSVRLFKTRAAAKTACEAGSVRVNGTVAKPATKVSVGATVHVRKRGLTGTYEVVEAIAKRVGAGRAAECMVDHTPEDQKVQRSPTSALNPLPDAPPARRERGAGRPTKRERRQIDKFRRG